MNKLCKNQQILRGSLTGFSKFCSFSQKMALKPLEIELTNMLRDDVIEGPIEIEEPGTYISNLVITDKKWDPSGKQIRLTLDCQAVNRDIYHTHEPIPTSEELRHQFAGSDRFSVLDLTNCFHQFEIEEEARKLFS